MISRYLRALRDKLRPELAAGVWPIRYKERQAVISDDFGRTKRGGRGHLGVDLMYRRQPPGADERPGKTKWYECPSNVVDAVSCARGAVVRIVRSKTNGGAVYVKHGRYLSVYRHLSRVFVSTGDVVIAGRVLGIVGHAPSAGVHGINHLHFEIWDTRRMGASRWGRADQAVDPEPFLDRWR